MHANSDNDPRTSPPWKYSSVLLIDGNPARQFERAAGMRRCGLHVDCAANAAAADALWEQDKYGLVLIELHGAAEDLNAFSWKLQRISPPQKIGIYRSQPPFILHVGDPLLRSTDTARLPRELMKEPSSDAAAQGVYGISQAAQKIRALRPPRARPAMATPIPDRPKPESHADVAARVLGGAE